jgi:hypothetical protein
MAPKGVLSEEMLKIINGEVPDKEKQYNASLHRWWQEYASRKNDEEHEHVADSLLYDERCHLPRTVPAPDVVKAAEASAKEQQPTKPAS